MKPLLCDSGPLIATFNDRDREFVRCARLLTELAKRLVSGPLGYVDGIVLAMAERLKITDIATADYKFLGMANPVSRLRPLRWVLQES